MTSRFGRDTHFSYVKFSIMSIATYAAWLGRQEILLLALPSGCLSDTVFKLFRLFSCGFSRDNEQIATEVPLTPNLLILCGCQRRCWLCIAKRLSADAKFMNFFHLTHCKWVLTVAKDTSTQIQLVIQKIFCLPFSVRQFHPPSNIQTKCLYTENRFMKIPFFR